MRQPPLSIMGSLRWEVVRRLLPRASGLDVLEIGCGQGSVAVRLASVHDYLGLEPDAGSFAVAERRLAELGRGEVRCGSLELVEPARDFDLVVSFEVIEHIEDDVSALAGWVGRVRPGGLLIISTPGYQRMFGPSDVAVGHYRRYEPAALADLLRDAGLDEVDVRNYGMPLGYVLQSFRNAVIRRRGGADPAAPIAERTARSGRFFQPAGAAAGAGIVIATWPFRYLQLLFPRRGPVLVARGRRPTA